MVSPQGAGRATGPVVTPPGTGEAVILVTASLGAGSCEVLNAAATARYFIQNGCGGWLGRSCFFLEEFLWRASGSHCWKSLLEATAMAAPGGPLLLLVFDCQLLADTWAVAGPFDAPCPLHLYV